MLEANGNPKKTKGSHFVNKGKVDPILKKAKELAKAEAKAEDDKPEPDIKTQLGAEFFEGKPAAPSNDTWAEQEAGDSDSHTSIEVEASTMAARLRIKLKQLLKLFGIEFDPENDEANGLKLVDEAQAERLFKEACEFDAAEAEAKAKAKAEAVAKAKAKAKADADVEAQKSELHTRRCSDAALAVAHQEYQAGAVEVEASAEAETEVETDDDESPVPYIVSSTQLDEPEAPETPQLDEPDETASDGIVDFDDEFSKQFIDQAQSVIMHIKSLA